MKLIWEGGHGLQGGLIKSLQGQQVLENNSVYQVGAV